MNNDLISREALKEYVKEIEDYESANTICGYIDNAPSVTPRDNYDLGYVQGLEDGRNADRWIPVTEKLPEKDGLYLVTFFTGLFNTRLCTTASYYLKCGWSMENVIYWKPLPEPYMKGGKE